MKKETLHILYTEEEIQQQVKEIAAKIYCIYAHEPLVMVCVLKGAFMFFSDLAKHVTVKPEIDFVRVASYGDSSYSSRSVRSTKDVEISLKDKHVLLVEDVVDSGHTVNFLMHKMSDSGAKSLRLAALIDKRERRETAVAVDFTGFTITSGFIVGYGLDYAEQYRNLPALHILDIEE
jgi:hypoxanthine phosphoribosyltransferase